MTGRWKTKTLLLLIAALMVITGYAQEEPAGEAPPSPPDLRNLGSGIWAYFEDTGDEDPRLRVESFLEGVETEIVNLRAPNQEIARSILDAMRDNMNAWLELIGEQEEEIAALPPPEENYTIVRLLEVAAESRDAQATAAQQQLEVEREQRILDGATERRDLSFKRYLETEDGDERWLAGLRLLQNRSALAIATRRVQLLTRRSEQANAYAEETEDRVNFASQRLPTTVTDEQLAKLQEDVVAAREAAEKAAGRLQAAEISASHLALDTPDGRSQQRLDRQKLVEAQVISALARLQSANAHALLAWAELLDGHAPDIKDLEERSLGTLGLVREIKDSIPDWQRDTGDELLAVETLNRDGLSRASRRLLDQRSGTAQATLARIEELQGVAEDLELILVVAETAFVENVGAFKSWLSVSSRFFRGLYQRVDEIADTTLFTISETPVAGSDILRAMVILLIAYLVSRGVRHAINRFNRTESAGTQASLYTVGRLSHYAIITIAVFVSLSTIGLDFSNIALVAGALSVGIGFGLQSIVSNFVSGLIILFEHSLRVGDYIELDTGLTGTVKAINVRSTLINTNDNIDIVVPNSEFVTARLTNWTLGERIIRIRIPFGVAYGSDKEVVRQAALEAAGEVQYTLRNMKGREPDVWLVEFGDSSLNFVLLVTVNRQGARRPLRTRASYLWALETKLSEYGIEIPFPQRDLHLRSGWQDVRPEATEPPGISESEEPEPAS